MFRLLRWGNIQRHGRFVAFVDWQWRSNILRKFVKIPVATAKSLAYSHRSFGAVAQLGERVVRNDEVRSSILLGSTTIQCGNALGRPELLK